MTRIPCARPADIIRLEAVDDLRIMPAYAYEKLVVLSVDPDQPNAPVGCKARAAADRSIRRIKSPFRVMLGTGIVYASVFDAVAPRHTNVAPTKKKCRTRTTHHRRGRATEVLSNLSLRY